MIDVVILCGGEGARVKHLFPDLPKCLFPVHGKPFLDHVIEFFIQQGFSRIILASGSDGDKIQDNYWNHEFNADLIFSKESLPLGTAGAIRFAKKYIKSEHFVVANGDSLCPINCSYLLQKHRSSPRLATIVVTKSKRKDAGNIEMNRNDRIISFTEKRLKEARRTYINAGIYVFHRDIILRIPKKRNKFVSLEETIFPLLIRPRKLFGYPVTEPVIDIGEEERYQEFIDK